MQPPTDNLYKFLAIFGLVVCMFSIYVPLLRYMEFNRLDHRMDAMYGPIIEQSRALADASIADLDCSIYQSYVREKRQPPVPDPCAKINEVKAKAARARAELNRLKEQVGPFEVERNLVWQEYVLFLYVGIVGLVSGVVMCGTGFWLWYVRLQKYLDASVKSQASQSRTDRVRISRSRRGI